MACACFTRNRQSSRSVRDAPGLFCQGCARSIPPLFSPPYPLLTTHYPLSSPSHVFSSACGLSSLSKKVNSFTIKQIQPLFRKHPGWGYLWSLATSPPIPVPSQHRHRQHSNLQTLLCYYRPSSVPIGQKFAPFHQRQTHLCPTAHVAVDAFPNRLLSLSRSEEHTS